MAFSIFHSESTWEKRNSKVVNRTDVPGDVQEADAVARSLLHRGRKINGIIENYDDELEAEQGLTAPRSGKRRNGR